MQTSTSGVHAEDTHALGDRGRVVPVGYPAKCGLVGLIAIMPRSQIALPVE
jgi:hypothetical protein